MAFVPFVESDQPTMAAFNEKFQQNYEAAVDACAKIEEGTYTGTGGSNTLTFGFVPKIVFITSDLAGNLTNANGVKYPVAFFAINGNSKMIVVKGDTSYAPSYGTCSFAGNTFSTSEYYAISNTAVYRYVAIG